MKTRKLSWISACVAVVLFCAAPSFADTVLSFDEAGHISLTSGGILINGATVSYTIPAPPLGTGGGFDSLGGGTLLYTLPSGYTFSLGSGINQYAVIVTDSSSMVSDLLIFQNSGAKGQVIVYDSPAAAASESGNGDHAKAYLMPMQGGKAYGESPYFDANYANPYDHVHNTPIHPEYLNSPDYMKLALTHLFTNFAVNPNGDGPVQESWITTSVGSGYGVNLVGGKSSINGGTTSVLFVSSVPLPAATRPAWRCSAGWAVSG